MQTKWLSLLGFLIVPFILFGCGVTVANESYVRVGFIDVTSNQIELALEGDSANLTGKIEYKVVPANATVRNVSFATKNPSVVTVDQTGQLTAVGIGITDVVITSAADNSVTASVRVRVVASQKKMSTPTNVQFDYENMELIWDGVRTDEDSYYTKIGYKLNIESYDLDGNKSETVLTPTTYNTRYSNFEINTTYTVKVLAMGNGTSYTDSDYSQSYTFAKLSDPTTLELVRVVDYLSADELAMWTESACMAGDTLNENFKVRYLINPLVLNYLNSEDEVEGEKLTITDFYSLSAIDANNTQNKEIESLWDLAFSTSCIRFCESDGKWYACFSVPNKLVNSTYKLRVSINNGVELNGIKLFSASKNANSIKVTQLSAPLNLMIRPEDNLDVRISWDPVSYAAGYVLEFRYKLSELDSDFTVVKQFEVTNKNFVSFSDIKEVTGNDVILDNYYDREIYIYTKALNTSVAGISYADSAFSSTPALIQLNAVSSINYNRDTGVVSWDRIANDTIENPICHYVVYVSGDSSTSIHLPEARLPSDR